MKLPFSISNWPVIHSNFSSRPMRFASSALIGLFVFGTATCAEVTCWTSLVVVSFATGSSGILIWLLGLGMRFGKSPGVRDGAGLGLFRIGGGVVSRITVPPRNGCVVIGCGWSMLSRLNQLVSFVQIGLSSL